jgi:hypothetical protein
MTHPTDDKGYRLPAHVRPSVYDADVVVEPAAHRFEIGRASCRERVSHIV